MWVVDLPGVGGKIFSELGRQRLLGRPRYAYTEK
jgi:hypothetical protein